MAELAPIPFAKQSAHDVSVKATLEQLINCYAESNPPDSETPFKVLSCPGLRPWNSYGNGPIRGMSMLNGNLMVVSGNQLFVVTSSGASTNLSTQTGILIGGVLPVSMASDDNAAGGLGQTFIATEVGSSVATTTTLAAVDTNYYGSLTMQDGYLIASQNDTNLFWFAGPDNFSSISPLNFASSDSYNGLAIAVASSNDIMTVFGSQFLTQYFNNGNPALPFAKVGGSGGGTIELGCGAAQSVALVQHQGSSVAIDFLAAKSGPTSSAQGSTGYSVQMLIDGGLQKISTPGIDAWIATRANPAGAQAWSYNQGGHEFYVLDFPVAPGGTIVYDHNTGLWHDRLTYGKVSYRANTHASAFGLDLVGDITTGQIYSLDPTYYQDGTNPLQRTMVLPKVSGQGNRFSCSELRLRFQAGVGQDGSGAGSNPQIAMDYTDDSGRTFSNQMFRTAGLIGQYSDALQGRWLRIGQLWDRSFRFQYDEPTPFIALGADACLEKRYG